MASGAGQLLPTRPAAAPQRRRRPLPHGPRLSYLHPRPTPPHAPPRPVCEAEAYLEQKGLKQFTRRTGVAAKPSNLPQINLGWGCNFKGVSGAQPPRPAAGNGRCVLNRARATPCQGLKGIFAGQTAVKGVVKKGLPLLPGCYEGGRAARRRGVAFVVHISFWAACAVADYGPLVVPQRVQSAVRPAPVPLCHASLPPRAGSCKVPLAAQPLDVAFKLKGCVPYLQSVSLWLPRGRRTPPEPRRRGAFSAAADRQVTSAAAPLIRSATLGLVLRTARPTLAHTQPRTTTATLPAARSLPWSAS